jgi:hypothetical protein
MNALLGFAELLAAVAPRHARSQIPHQQTISGAPCNSLCRTAVPSEHPPNLYELMFAPANKITNRLTDAADLLIDFATLGEYGLEPVGRTRQGCADPSPAPAASRRSSGTRTTARSSNCTLLQESGLFRPRRTRPGQPA